MAAIRQEKIRSLTTPLEHFNLLHTPNQQGVVVVWERQGQGKRWHKLAPGDAWIPLLLEQQAGTHDTFITVNEFRSWRQVSNLKSLRALYVDIDRHLDYFQVLEGLNNAFVPIPSFMVWSGRGVHLYWLHDPVPAQVLPVWQRCQDALICSLADLGADRSARDCTRLLRMPGTRNAKNGVMVEGRILDPEPWGFHALSNEILGYRLEPQKFKAPLKDFTTAKANRGQRVITGSIYDWWHLVYKDLLAIAQHHWFGGIPEGHRDTFLFLSSVALSWFAHADTLSDELTRRAQTWTPGLRTSEVKAAISCSLERAEKAASGQKVIWNGQERDPRYWYKRETLHQMLEPLIPAELAPQLRAVVSEEVRAEHKRETDRKHEAKRDRVAEGRYESHQRGRKETVDSLEQQKPWEALGISRRTYYNWKAEGKLS